MIAERDATQVTQQTRLMDAKASRGRSGAEKGNPGCCGTVQGGATGTSVPRDVADEACA
jgi:hypothetical protein